MSITFLTLEEKIWFDMMNRRQFAIYSAVPVGAILCTALKPLEAASNEDEKLLEVIKEGFTKEWRETEKSLGWADREVNTVRYYHTAIQLKRKFFSQYDIMQRMYEVVAYQLLTQIQRTKPENICSNCDIEVTLDEPKTNEDYIGAFIEIQLTYRAV